MPRTNRRRFLVGCALGVGLLGGTAVGIEEGWLPGRRTLYAGLGLNGDQTSVPSSEPGPQVNGSFHSERRRTEVGWTIAYPPGVRPGASIPVVVALHGRSQDRTALFGERIGLDRFLAADPHRYAIAAVDGGDTYWHPRASGEDAGAMVTEEFLPLLASHGLHTQRIGLYGYSMGGYGVLRLAAVLGAQRVAAVVAVSAALWDRAGDTPAGAFDHAADFAAHDVMGRQNELRGIPVRLDCGRGDAFATAVRHYRAGFDDRDRPAGGFQAGAHDESYLRRVAPAELAFLWEHLSS